MCDAVRAAAQEKHNDGNAYSKWVCTGFQTQVVAGTNWNLKVQVDDEGGFVHLKVFQALPHTGNAPSLSNSADGKSDSDDISWD